MATYQLPLDGSTIYRKENTSEKHTSGPSTVGMNHRRKVNDGPPVLVMWAYFLGLASIAVVVIGGQFPWFTLAPAIVLLMVTHFRHVEAKYQRKSSDGRGIDYRTV